MNPEFVINTQRLQLRLLSVDEAVEFARLIQYSPSLHRWIDWCHAHFNQQEAERFILATRLNWIKADAYGFAVIDKATQQIVGMVAINEFSTTFNMASLGYWIGDDHQQQGFGKEALAALIEWSFAQLKLTRLEIICDPSNIPSQQLARACEAKQECLAQNRFIFHGQPKAGLVFSIIPEPISSGSHQYSNQYQLKQ